MKILEKYNKYLFPAILLLLSLLMHRIWFSPDSILTSGDWGFSPNDQVRGLWNTWTSWVNFDGFGNSNAQLPFYGFMAIWGALGQIGFSYMDVTKITIFIPIAILIFISPYYFALELSRHRFGSFIAALFYATTTYGMTNQPPIQMVYAITPLILLLLLRLIREPSYRKAIYLGILYTVGLIYEVRIMYIVTGIMLVLYILFCKNVVKNIWPYIITAISVVISLNLFWLLPLLDGPGVIQQISSITNRGLFGDNLYDIVRSITMSSWNWNGHTQNVNFVVQSIVPNLWVVPIFIFFSLAIYRPKKDFDKSVIAFLIISLVGIFLTKQSGEPFRHVYEYLYNHFPGFSLFREASKFYLITAVGYTGLLAVLISKRYRNLNFTHKRYFTLGVVIVGLACTYNLKPFFTNEIKDLYVNKTIPSDYLVLDKFLASDSTYSRTLWLPVKSRWGYYTELHPKVNAVDLKQTTWSFINPYTSIDPTSINNVSSLSINSIFNKPFSEELFRNTSIKYVIVPTRDSLNNDDIFAGYGDNRDDYIKQLDVIPWLKKINIGTKELAIYEYQKYKPYVYATAELNQLNSLNKIDSVYSFYNSTVNSKQFNFISKAPVGTSAPITMVNSLTNNLSVKNISSDGININIKLPLNQTNTLYVNTSPVSYSFKILANTISIYSNFSNSLIVNNLVSNQNPDNKFIGDAILNDQNNYFISKGNDLYQIDQANKNTRTLSSTNDSMGLFSVQKNNNLVNNGSFENGPWHLRVDDCNKYDNNQNIGMQLNSITHYDGRYSLELLSGKHTACTESNSMAVSGGSKLLLSYKYMIKGGQRAGYDIVFNDPKKTIISADQIMGRDKWYEFDGIINVPDGATEMYLRIKGYPDELQREISHTLYDDVIVAPLSQIDEIKSQDQPVYIANVLNDNNLNLRSSAADNQSKNLIQNPSLETGLWQKTVNDCNHYDNKAVLSMGINKTYVTSGSNSLELSAANHIACTSPNNISVQESKKYLLSFDYLSPTKSDAGINAGFNDPKDTNISQRLNTGDKNWHHYSKIITAPYGADSLKLTVYSYANSFGDIKQSDIYDNFSLIMIPNIENRYYVVSKQNKNLETPQSIDYKIINTTEKTIKVKGATTPFYLNMSEGYSDGWSLGVSQHHDRNNLLSMFESQIQNKISSNNHFMNQNYLNSWYIDPLQLCQRSNQSCTRNANGSFDIDLTAEYSPQRSFYIGRLISILAAILIAIGLIVFLFRYKRRA